MFSQVSGSMIASQPAKKPRILLILAASQVVVTWGFVAEQGCISSNVPF